MKDPETLERIEAIEAAIEKLPMSERIVLVYHVLSPAEAEASGLTEEEVQLEIDSAAQTLLQDERLCQSIHLEAAKRDEVADWEDLKDQLELAAENDWTNDEFSEMVTRLLTDDETEPE